VDRSQKGDTEEDEETQHVSENMGEYTIEKEKKGVDNCKVKDGRRKRTRREIMEENSNFPKDIEEFIHKESIRLEKEEEENDW
jgi:hypothetical protein